MADAVMLSFGSTVVDGMASGISAPAILDNENGHGKRLHLDQWELRHQMDAMTDTWWIMMAVGVIGIECV